MKIKNGFSRLLHILPRSKGKKLHVSISDINTGEAQPGADCRFCLSLRLPLTEQDDGRKFLISRRAVAYNQSAVSMHRLSPRGRHGSAPSLVARRPPCTPAPARHTKPYHACLFTQT